MPLVTEMSFCIQRGDWLSLRAMVRQSKSDQYFEISTIICILILYVFPYLYDKENSLEDTLFGRRSTETRQLS